MDRRGLIAQPHAHVPVGQRPCTTHIAVAAQQRCDRCARPFCLACLRHVERWLICARCLEELHRERAAASLPGRWRRWRTEAAAGLFIVLLVVGLFGLIQDLLGPAGSDASLARTAVGISGGMADGGHGRPTPLPTPTAPPIGKPQLTLAGGAVSPGYSLMEYVRCGGFQANESLTVRGTLTGRDANGRTDQATVLVTFPVESGPDGVVTVAVDFGHAPSQFRGTVTMTITAAGLRGDSATVRAQVAGTMITALPGDERPGTAPPASG
jgi:hypothetical protein